MASYSDHVPYPRQVAAKGATVASGQVLTSTLLSTVVQAEAKASKPGAEAQTWVIVAYPNTKPGKADAAYHAQLLNEIAKTHHGDANLNAHAMGAELFFSSSNGLASALEHMSKTLCQANAADIVNKAVDDVAINAAQTSR